MKQKYARAFMKSAFAWAETSEAKRLQVGAVIVKNDDTQIAQGVNGTYSGLPNHCEDLNGETLPWVRHAEQAALDKLVRSTNSSEGCTMFVTHAPCIMCAYRIYDAGILKVVYSKEYRSTEGINYLRSKGIIVEKMEET